MNVFNTRRTLGNTRNGTSQRPRQLQRCACGRFWESGRTPWVNGDRRLDILGDPFYRQRKGQNEQNFKVTSQLAKIPSSKVPNIHPSVFFGFLLRQAAKHVLEPSSAPENRLRNSRCRGLACGWMMLEVGGFVWTALEIMFVCDCPSFGISALPQNFERYQILTTIIDAHIRYQKAKKMQRT